MSERQQPLTATPHPEDSLPGHAANWESESLYADRGRVRQTTHPKAIPSRFLREKRGSLMLSSDDETTAAKVSKGAPQATQHGQTTDFARQRKKKCLSQLQIRPSETINPLAPSCELLKEGRSSCSQERHGNRAYIKSCGVSAHMAVHSWLQLLHRCDMKTGT